MVLAAHRAFFLSTAGAAREHRTKLTAARSGPAPAMPYIPGCSFGKMKNQVTSPAMTLKISTATRICIQKRNQLIPLRGAVCGADLALRACSGDVFIAR